MIHLPATLLLALCMLAPVTIERDAPLPPVTGELVEAGLQGIHVRTEGDAVELIPWYQLRAGELPDGIDTRHRDTAWRTWAARARLDRGDTAGALPLYADMRQTYLWHRGPQAADVCDGLTTCLIDAGHRARAVEPMLAGFVATAGEPEPSQPTVRNLMLRRDLPPVFLAEEMGVGLAPIPPSAGVDARTRLFHAYYALVLAPPDRRGAIADSIPELQRALGARDPGLVLLEQMCYAQAHPDETMRQAARDALARRTRTQEGTWMECWARLGLGASLIRDENPQVRDRGVVHLIHIIVRLSTVDPGLTLLAARIAREHLDGTGRADWGVQLEHDAYLNIAGLGLSPTGPETLNHD